MYRYWFPNLKICKQCPRYKKTRHKKRTCHECRSKDCGTHWQLWVENRQWWGGHATEVPIDCPFMLEQTIDQGKPSPSFLKEALKTQEMIDAWMFDDVLNLFNITKQQRQKILRILNKHGISKYNFLKMVELENRSKNETNES